ncbi:MAG: histidine kinase [Chloroflexi bacterium HGW-Chloroflexi-1]|nr:MAG: histidine kinase [Chloroflexi bacterium HGW-Chloroflexi-1]
MSSQDLAEVAADLLVHLDHFSHKDDPKTFWQQALTWLQRQTCATGAWLKLSAPPPLTLRVGELGRTSLAFAQAWGSEPALAPEAGFEVHRLADATLLCVWLHEGEPAWAGVPVGYLALSFPPEMSWPDNECAQLQGAIQALHTLSHQATTLAQTQDRLDRFQHLYEVGQAISSTLDLDQVLKQCADRVTEVLHAEASTLMLVDEAKRELVFKIPAGPAEHVLREQRMPMDKGVAGWVATHGEPLIIPDVNVDDRFYTQIDTLSGFRTRSILAVPLQVKGKIIGIAEVINKIDGDSFTPDDQQWLSTLAPLIGAAIENARLFTALREEHDRIITAEEQVRHELARDLHDGPAQILSTIILNIDMARRQLAARPEKMATELNFLESLAQEANQEVRGLLFSLRPLALETHGLTAALTQLVERARPHAPYEIHLDFGALSDRPIAPRVSSMLFVIIQEALNNTTKHASARNVIIRLGTAPAHLWAEVEDDGVGFDVQEVDAHYNQRNSFGLLNMRERARLIDGGIVIRSPLPGRAAGTQVRVEVPLERATATG